MWYFLYDAYKMSEKEMIRLKRMIFIWENIGIGMNPIQEIATKQFLEKIVTILFIKFVM